MRLLPVLAFAACAITRHPMVPAEVPPASGAGWAAVAAGVAVAHEPVVSARWAVARAGLIDLTDPAAADLPKDDLPIVLAVHVLTHPTAGVFIVDTGITRDRAAGGHGGARGLVRGALDGIEPVEPLGDILARQDAPLAGVILTHAHLDHVLGLPDVPPGTPIYVGPDELRETDWRAPLIRPTYRALFDGHDPVRALDPADAVSLGPVDGIDLVGDGSIWVIPVPGHTAGSLAVLARTQDGFALFVGDTSHTRWGWDNGVTPGRFTSDHDANAESLAALKALAEAHELTVYVGHELEL